eukprot:SAG31_NODE_521_length_14624_cov_34.536867_6_plen_163_part_00
MLIPSSQVRLITKSGRAEGEWLRHEHLPKHAPHRRREYEDEHAATKLNDEYSRIHHAIAALNDELAGPHRSIPSHPLPRVATLQPRWVRDAARLEEEPHLKSKGRNPRAPGHGCKVYASAEKWVARQRVDSGGVRQDFLRRSWPGRGGGGGGHLATSCRSHT